MNGHFFEGHLILCQSASLITHDVVDSAQFLWNLTTSGYGILHLLIFIYPS